jgi:predicted metal-dependent phosphoesterase TrpH
LIDLHTHTTESDGRSTPEDLVHRARAAGVTVLAVTDHDTVSGCDATAAACATAGIRFVSGIEITAVRGEADVHVLGYFIDIASPRLHAFLADQRRQRLDRLRQVAARLQALGISLDIEKIVRPAIDNPRKAAGRPWIARALVEAGHAATSEEAFERWLGQGRAAFVPRSGATPAEVITRIHDAEGLASLAHPVLVGHDDWIADLVEEGLDAIEAYHSEHDAETTARYVAMAAALKVAVSGGSDYHGDETHGPAAPGAVSLPEREFEKLVARRRRAGPPKGGR